MNTGKLVRASAHERIVITERGRAVALLKGATPPDLIGKPFPKRDRIRKAILRALKGARVIWGKRERTASVPVRA
jgi:antitoxin (DNA-binding transcriptional repressor) of toxin-antitoxin stability system